MPDVLLTAGLTVVFSALALIILLAAGATAAGAQSPEITIELSTNGTDADTAPGPTLQPGSQVTWQYQITIDGPNTMYDVIVSDSSGAVPSCDVDGDGGLDGTHSHPGPLEPGQSFHCVATGTAQSEGGTFASIAKVRAFDFDGVVQFEDQDRSHYNVEQQFVANPNVAIQSLINGVDSDTAPGPYVEEGSSVTWSYIVTNTGNVPLASVAVTSSGPVAIDCGGGSNTVPGSLAPGATATCAGTTEAALFEAGLQSTSSSVTASAVDPSSGATLSQLSAQDPQNYTPVRLPGALAFTGPSDVLRTTGLAMLGLGGAMWLTAWSIARRRTAATTTG